MAAPCGIIAQFSAPGGHHDKRRQDEIRQYHRLGKCLPPAALTNDDLQHHHGYLGRVDLPAHRHQGPSGLPRQPPRRSGHLAARRALACAGPRGGPRWHHLATATPGNLLPNGASAVQPGAVKAAVFDLNAACTGFVCISVATSRCRPG